MTDHDPIQVSFADLADFRHQLTDLSIAFANAIPAVSATETDLTAGAGELAQHLAFGAAEFTLAWTSTLEAMRQGAALIGNNIGQSALDFHAVDVAYSSDIQL